MSYYCWRPNSSFQFHVSQITNFRGHTTFAWKIHALSICYSKYEFFPTLSIFRLAVCALPFGFTVMKVLDNTTEPYASVNSHPLGEQPRICLRLDPRGGEFEILLFPRGNNKIFPAKKKKNHFVQSKVFSPKLGYCAKVEDRSSCVVSSQHVFVTNTATLSMKSFVHQV